MKYILPGMGATSQMYAGPWRRIREACFVDWPPYNGEASISDLAQALISRYPIGRQDIVIGTSLGGMVGMEIDKLIGVKSVFLVGSAVHAAELSLVSRALMPFATKPVVKITQRLASFSTQIVHQMYSTSDPGFIVGMSRAIRSWPGFSGRPGQKKFPGT